MLKLVGNGAFEKFYYPCGEVQIRIKDYDPFKEVKIEFEFEENEEVIQLLFLVDALRRASLKINGLYMPYIPYSRQDRVCSTGDSFSLKVFADIINGLNIPVYVLDPHSDVAYAVFDDLRVVPQSSIFSSYLPSPNQFWLISPDGGALKKIYTLADVSKPRGVIICNKVRNALTGEITGVTVHSDNLLGLDCYIVDDICDGGRTFTEIARVLKTKNCGKIVLMVTHGFFTKGMGVFDGLIDEIYTRNGRVK